MGIDVKNTASPLDIAVMEQPFAKSENMVTLRGHAAQAPAVHQRGQSQGADDQQPDVRTVAGCGDSEQSELQVVTYVRCGVSSPGGDAGATGALLSQYRHAGKVFICCTSVQLP